MNPKKLWQRIEHGQYANIAFNDFIQVVEAFGCRYDRARGSHRYYVHEALLRPLCFQPLGTDAKPYQVRQFRKEVEKAGLHLGEDR